MNCKHTPVKLCRTVCIVLMLMCCSVCTCQVLGHKEGLNVMEGVDPIFLLICLPSIPVVLMCVNDFTYLTSHRKLLVQLLPFLGKQHLSDKRNLNGEMYGLNTPGAS